MRALHGNCSMLRDPAEAIEGCKTTLTVTVKRVTLCGRSGEFWIACDYCDVWYDGKCVQVGVPSLPRVAAPPHPFSCPTPNLRTMLASLEGVLLTSPEHTLVKGQKRFFDGLCYFALQMTAQKAERMGKWRCPACERRLGM